MMRRIETREWPRAWNIGGFFRFRTSCINASSAALVVFWFRLSSWLLSVFSRSATFELRFSVGSSIIEVFEFVTLKKNFTSSIQRTSQASESVNKCFLGQSDHNYSSPEVSITLNIFLCVCLSWNVDNIKRPIGGATIYPWFRWFLLPLNFTFFSLPTLLVFFVNFRTSFYSCRKQQKLICWAS